MLMTYRFICSDILPAGAYFLPTDMYRSPTCPSFVIAALNNFVSSGFLFSSFSADQIPSASSSYSVPRRSDQKGRVRLLSGI